MKRAFTSSSFAIFFCAALFLLPSDACAMREWPHELTPCQQRCDDNAECLKACEERMNPTVTRPGSSSSGSADDASGSGKTGATGATGDTGEASGSGAADDVKRPGGKDIFPDNDAPRPNGSPSSPPAGTRAIGIM